MGVNVATAVRMASEVPASVMGLGAERGLIRAGMRADMVLIDSGNNVVETWISGQ
jgi:N-acetylglucosamine-6-phosphate deacetylase